MTDLPNIKVSKKIKFISKISRKGGSWYVLVPARYAKKLQLKDNDNAVVVIGKLELVEGDEYEG